jgi:hypothetical protein
MSVVQHIEEFFRSYNDYEFILMEFVGIVMKKVGQDPELLAIYKQYERYYQSLIKEDELKEQDSLELDTGKQDHYDKRQNSERDMKLYEYFVVRQYDPELRKKQKLEHKRGIRISKSCDGKIEHRIKEKDIPPDIVQKLRLRPRSKTML